ncbi:MAG: hypothetical protein KGH72_01710 [Candidatus Micrarchaeota archaeon]|nr:hypothetical protein [Candidatus Micrarchaeota archaeon]
MGEKPKLVFVLVFLGALAILYGSVNLIYQANGMVGGIIGIFGGLLSLLSSIMLYSSKEATVKQWSSIALLAAFLSTAAFYNIYLGFSFVIIGSILGLTHQDVIVGKEIFIVTLLGGIALFIGSIFLISTSGSLLIIETGLIGALLGIFVIMNATKLYGSTPEFIQRISLSILIIGVISLSVDLLSISLAIRAVLPIGIAVGTILTITGSYSGSILPNIYEHNRKREAAASKKGARRTGRRR